MRPPRVHPESPLAANPRQVAPVEDLEDQSEALLQLASPLLDHRGRSRDDDGLRLPPQQQLPGDQPGLDRLPEPGVVGDEQVHPGQTQGLAQGLHLVGVDLDAGAEGGLEQVGVGRRDAVPAQGVEEGGELPRRVEPFRREIGPALFLEDQAVDLVVPVDLEALALGVVVSAGEAHERGCGSVGYHLLDQPAAGANQDQLTRFRGFFGQAIYK